MYDSDGNPKPKPYILARITAVDGMTVEEACALEFPDKNGRPSLYRRDIRYDLFTSQWIRIESTEPRAAAAASLTHDSEEARVAGSRSFSSISDAVHSVEDRQGREACGWKRAEHDSAAPAESTKCFYKSVYGDPLPGDHPDGSLSLCLGRHRRRIVQRILLRSRRRRQRAAVRESTRLPRYARAHRNLNRVMLSRSGTAEPDSLGDSHEETETEGGEPLPDGLGASADDIRHACNIAMRDLPWKPYLYGKESRHKDDVLRAYRSEVDSLKSTVLRELKPGDAEWDAAQRNHTTCRALLEWKRQGLWKVRIVIQGHKENKLALDGPDFNYSSDVVGITAIRALFMKPLQKGEAIGQCDISTAFLQSDLFPEGTPPRYLMLPDPVTGTNRYFRQLGVVYGSASSPKRWQDTLDGWLTKPESENGGGYTQGKNDPCLFTHERLGVTLATYVDDCAVRGQRAKAEEAFAAIRARFKCKDVHWLSPGQSLDHLGMTFFQDDSGTYLSMENYIDAMVTRIGIDPDKGRHQSVPMSSPITDYTPLSREAAKWINRKCSWFCSK